VSRAARLAAVLLLAAAVSAASAVAAPRLHRTKLPPAPPLPTSLAVDEGEWQVVPSQKLVAAGTVTLRVYNRGEDDHDLAVVDGSGREQSVYLAPGTSGTLQVTLPPGAWKLYCSLFAGSPDSHEALGMAAVIRAKRAPARRATTARP
jgi:plastocyanin